MATKTLKTVYGKTFFALSVSLLIVSGHWLARYFSKDKSTAWLYVLLFYAAWLIVSIVCFTNARELKQMFQPSKNARWTLLPLVFIIPTIFALFIPNIGLLKPDKWLVMNIIICATGPWLEEIYWRGLFTKFYGTSFTSFLLSSVLFGISHPLIFGVNSKGDSGIIAFAGTFFVGAVWWFCYHKTKSLRGPVATHVLTDVAGMAVYVLINTATLLPF